MFTSIQFNNFLSPQGSIYLNGIAGGGGGGGGAIRIEKNAIRH